MMRGRDLPIAVSKGPIQVAGMVHRLLTLTGTLVVLMCLPASASSSQWHESEGGAVRLITAGTPDARGRLKGALEIRLKPGWKTYWRDPGPSGIPPQLDISRSTNVEDTEIFYPPPERIDDGFSQAAGYASSVSLPITFMLEQPGAPTLIKAEVLLGICQTICVPLQADITLDPAEAPDELRDLALVTAAYSALPPSPRADFRLQEAKIEGDRLLVEASVPKAARTTDLFVASGGGYLFGQPKQISREAGKITFSIKLHEKPEDPSPAAGFAYTLTADGESVAGEFQLP